MVAVFFQPFREWVNSTRRRKGWKKAFRVFILKVARNPHTPGRGCEGGMRKIARDFGQSSDESLLELRSRMTSWFNLEQLQEPRIRIRELVSTSRS